MNKAPALLWFRQDLRLEDNPALTAALAASDQVIPLYILDDESLGERRMGGAQRWWLHHSLAALDEALQAAGSRLILRRGRAGTILREVVEAQGVEAAFWNRCYDPETIARDKDIKRDLVAAGLTVESFNGLLLAEPWETKTKDGGFFKVYSPFWRALQSHYRHASTLPAPTALPAVDGIASDRLESWDLLPRNPDWAEAFGETWSPGADGAKVRLRCFLEQGLKGYKSQRDRPDRDSTSRLSPHLRFGEISPRQIWQSVEEALAGGDAGQADADKFLAEVGWREFAYHLLYHVEGLADRPLRPEFEAFPWQDDDTAFIAWAEGQTGYPIVDAGMRQLWRSGWMHNRVRMIVASFLVKDLLIPWQRGERWFWDTLVDADPANNTASWQWVAGCGADAAPYFRVFNPILQGERFDPGGAYVRRWVPELSALPDKLIHKPWEAPAPVLREAGVVLGESYPERLVDHGAARQRALAAFADIKKEKAA
ncbi:MAG: deoxyribodipyrimidine photo-lyase [Rhodospirillales bacterium]